MKTIKTLVSMAAGAAAMFAISQAGDIAPCPDDYGLRATDYIESRLENPRGASVQIVSEPYRVEADVAGYSGIEGWGVDVRVKSRLQTGSFGRYLDYTVIFVDGAPVALEDDADEMIRV